MSCGSACSTVRSNVDMYQEIPTVDPLAEHFCVRYSLWTEGHVVQQKKSKQVSPPLARKNQAMLCGMTSKISGGQHIHLFLDMFLFASEIGMGDECRNRFSRKCSDDSSCWGCC